MRLFEIFDKPENDWILKNTMGGYIAEFSIGKNNYYVDLSWFDLMDIIEEFEGENLQIPKEILTLKTNTNIIDISFYLVRGRETDIGITSTGNEYQVFATVIAITKNFLAQEGGDVEYLHISAKESSRIKLYDRMVRSFNKPTLTYNIHGQKSYLVKIK